MAEGSIKAIGTGCVHRITSGQVVVDLQTAVKELVENCLDAGATTIEIRVKENGLGTIEVVDNGKGIPKEDYDFVALKHHTSKLTCFEDLAGIETFGFRGEALSSLCALCESVTVTTATSEDAPMATVLEFDRMGRVLSHSGKVARSRGTTVMLRGLFTPLPVRRKEFERHAKREFGKVLTLISAYALVPCSQENGGVKLTLMQVSETGKKSLQIQTDGSPSLKSSITALWGSKAVEQLVPVAGDLLVEPDTAASKRRNAKVKLVDAPIAITVQVSGFISRFSPGSGRPSNDRQFFFVNGRPCAFSKAQKAINEVYRSFNALQNPVVIMDFRLPRDSTDVNVSPNKRTIFILHEENLIEQLKLALTELLGSDTSSFAINDPTANQTPTSTITRRTRSAVDIPEPDQIALEKLNSAVEVEEPLFLPSDDLPPFPALPNEGVNIVAKEILEEPTPSGPPSGVTSPRASLTTSDEEDNRGRKNNKRLSLKRKASGSPLRSPSVEPAEAANRPPLAQPLKEPTAFNAPRCHSGPVQMVLSTASASWALQKGLGGPAKTSVKGVISKPPVGSSSALKGMRSILNQFKRSGAGAVKEVESEDEENDEEMVADEDVDVPKMPAKGDDSTMVVDQARPAPRIPVPIPGPTVAVTATSLGDIIDTNQQVQVQNSLQGSSDQPNSGMIVSEIDPSTRRTADDCSPVKVPSEREVVEIVPDDEVVRSFVISTTTVRFDLASVEVSWRAAASSLRTSATSAPDHATSSFCTIKPSEITSNAREAEATLSRVVSKDDFGRMDILGQFNRAFVITRLCKPADGHDDLFIVDQHAADEKYNFERLQIETRIELQKLIKPRRLSFSAADRLVAMEHLDVLQRNGFEVGISKEGRGTTEDLVLVAQPVSKSTVFDMQDLEELVSLLHDAPPGRMVRCSKARAMFASRACRSSVMVGDTLSPVQMVSVVRHMGTMDQPWNCPHGRPTMRHLASMPTPALVLKGGGGKRVVEWGKRVE